MGLIRERWSARMLGLWSSGKDCSCDNSLVRYRFLNLGLSFGCVREVGIAGPNDLILLGCIFVSSQLQSVGKLISCINAAMSVLHNCA